ncbi:MAG: DEAD/DEAH box helicase family protein, partial [Candidatus Gracilibacteria bacterium]|nr:DEAD/DEAH box helicase family protein [Candidatus Gracilibacteria bacterium]
VKISEDKIRSITGIVTERQFIAKENILLAEFISDYYFTQIHNSINLFFPSIVRKKILSLNEKFFERINNNVGNENFHSLQNIELKLNLFSEKQKKAYLQIKNNFNIQNTPSPLRERAGVRFNLLYGITGSGKTEIYIKLILDNLENNKQSLLLIPEIILNNQIGAKLIKIFGEDNIIIINSSITPGKKAEYFADIYTGKSKIIIGTRSSLFFPYKNLGLIIMDEEHDNSYNSDKSPRYKTKEILQKKLELNPSLNILLASGTPSINSMYKAVKGEWNLINLLEKYRK